MGTNEVPKWGMERNSLETTVLKFSAFCLCLLVMLNHLILLNSFQCLITHFMRVIPFRSQDAEKVEKEKEKDGLDNPAATVEPL